MDRCSSTTALLSSPPVCAPAWWRRGAAAVVNAPAALSRRLPGRPLTLALGWLLSCVVITAVTLTAVEQVGREVSGSQGLIATQAGVAHQAAVQSASAASAASASSASPVQAPTSVAPAVLTNQQANCTRRRAQPYADAKTIDHAEDFAAGNSDRCVDAVVAGACSREATAGRDRIHLRVSRRPGRRRGRGGQQLAVTNADTYADTVESGDAFAAGHPHRHDQHIAVAEPDPDDVDISDPNRSAHSIGVARHEQELHLRQARDTADHHRPDQHRLQRRLDRERQRHDVR